jgi:hypothetical protein
MNHINSNNVLSGLGTTTTKPFHGLQYLSHQNIPNGNKDQTIHSNVPIQTQQ